MHVEHLDWLANNPRYTQRFAMHVGKLCRDMPNKAVAEMERLHHSTVKDLDKLYMQKQVDLAAVAAQAESSSFVARSAATWQALEDCSDIRRLPRRASPSSQ